jgi:hypothetical protein
MVTVVVSIALLALGLAILFLPQAQIVDLLRDVGLPADIERIAVSLVGEQLFAYACLAAAPLLLVAGSLLKGL